jgi:hypothetical protein
MINHPFEINDPFDAKLGAAGSSPGAGGRSSRPSGAEKVRLLAIEARIALQTPIGAGA